MVKELGDLKGVYVNVEELLEGKQTSCVWYHPLCKVLKMFSFTQLEFDHKYITWEIWIHQELYIDSLLAK